MLQITIPAVEKYDSVNNLFYTSKEYHLCLEHSLVSISKWESKWKKPFFGREEKTHEESIDYIRCMTLTQNVDPEAYTGINSKIFQKISEYIDEPMTATKITEHKTGSPSREVYTAEIIYYLMISYGIPFECQKWHINKLITLIKVCEIKNSPTKKMSSSDIMAQNRALNAKRKAAMNTKG